MFKDPGGTSARPWDSGDMTERDQQRPYPEGFANPVPTYPSITAGARDANGNLLPPSRGSIFGQPPGSYAVVGNYILPLMACVVDGTVAVIPGPGGVCGSLGIQVLRP